MTLLRFLAAVVAAAVATFFFGFLYWGVNPAPYRSLMEVTDEPVAREALKRHFPDNGTYVVPGLTQDQETLEKLHEEGPVAFVHMMAVNGRPMMGPAMMVQGFLLNVIVAGLLGILLLLGTRPDTSYLERVRFAGLFGCTAAILIDFGDVVWWGESASWKLHMAIYHIGFAVVAGLVLAAFMRKPASVS